MVKNGSTLVVTEEIMFYSTFKQKNNNKKCFKYVLGHLKRFCIENKLAWCEYEKFFRRQKKWFDIVETLMYASLC